MTATSRVFVRACALWLISLAAQPAEPRIGSFVAYETDDYTIITSRSEHQARQFVEDLAKFRLTLEKALGKRATKSGIPTHIVIASRSEWEKYLSPRQNVAGFFQRGHFANYMVMNGDSPRGEALRIIFHEYTHFYLASQFAGEYPPWFNEGLAELMAFAKFTDKGMAILQIPMYRVYEARDGDWIPFERLIRIDHHSPEYQSHKLANSFYAQAWLTVHYGMVENRKFGAQIIEFLNQLNRLHPHDEAARNAFGPDLDVIDQQLREYSRSSRMSSGALALGEIPAVTLGEGKPLAENDALAVIADLMLETRLAPDRIRPIVHSLQRREPRSARPTILAARLAEFEDESTAFDSAVAAAEGALHSGDWTSRRELAAVLLRSAMDMNPLNTRSTQDTERDLKRALKWYGEALIHNPEDVETLWGFGTTATMLDTNLDLAEDALVAAYRRSPANADIAVSLANLKGKQNEPEAMIPFLNDTIRYANDLGTRQWATETLAEMQKFLAERRRIDAENRKQQEAYEQQLAEYEKKYGPKRKK